MTELLRILIAPLVWLAAFSGVYALHGLGCALGWPEVEVLSLSVFRVVLVSAWLVAISFQVLLVVALHSQRFGSRSSFVRRTSLATAWVGLVTTLWTLHPVALVSSCGALAGAQ